MNEKTETIQEEKKQKELWKRIRWILAAVALAAIIAGIILWQLPNWTEKEPKMLAAQPVKQDQVLISTWQEADLTSLFAYIDSLRDHTAPVISGVQDQVVVLGSTIRYKEGVSAMDDVDGEVRFDVDVTEVNENEEGSYTVRYTAVDSSGNQAEETAVFTFVVPESDLGFLEEDPAFGKYSAEELPILVEKIYSGICTEDMDQYTKAFELYYWVMYHIGYYGVPYDDTYSNMDLEAVAGLHLRGGNCFTYTSISKALLDRAGIENMVVQKVHREEEADHYWLMVNIDGEWYHYDSTPRIGDDDFFLWTDEAMLLYSEAHWNCFDFDLTQYPRTPGELEQRFLDRWYGETTQE